MLPSRQMPPRPRYHTPTILPPHHPPSPRPCPFDCHPSFLCSPPSPSSTVSSRFLIMPSRLFPGTTQKQVINKGQDVFQILPLIDDSGLTSSVFVQFTRLVLCSCGHSGWRPWILFSATISPSTVRDLRGFGGILSRVPPLGILCKVSVCVSVWLCLFLCRCLCPGHPRQ